MRFERNGDVPFQLDKILNNGITFLDNVAGVFIEFETTGAEQEITHNLGFTPVGYIIILKTGALDLWTTDSMLTRWNQTTLFLQSNVSSQRVRLFVM